MQIQGMNQMMQNPNIPTQKKIPNQMQNQNITIQQNPEKNVQNTNQQVPFNQKAPSNIINQN